MKSKLASLALMATLLTSSLMAQEKKDKKLADKVFSDLVGTWRIQTIYEGKKDITSTDSTKVQWLEFNEDGHYKSVTGELATDSGSYRVNESQKSLYLQSALNNSNNGNVAEWKVEMKDNNMTLTQTGNTRTDRNRYLYVKTKDKTTANKPIKPQQ